MKKGFTLIELLAVIVILAIIALIAVPIVLGIVSDSKEETKKKKYRIIYRYSTKENNTGKHESKI